MKPKPLSIDLLRIDGDTQSRISINGETVDDYTAIIEAGGTQWLFPPVDVFFDGTDYFVADGFHRLLSAVRAKRSSIPCTVHKGTARDARIFGMTANDQHGLRMSRADKRACVEWLLDQPGKMTQEEMAQIAGVGKRLVQQIVADKKAHNAHSASPSGGGDDKEGDSETGKDDGSGKKPKEKAPRTPRKGKEGSGGSGDAFDAEASKELPPDLEQCPNCAANKWEKDDDGFIQCKKCCHPYGEPAGDVDEDRVNKQRALTIKHIEGTMRAVEDLNLLRSHGESKDIVEQLKAIWKRVKSWR